jgi:hypothetical protein
MSDVALESVDLSAHTFAPPCEMRGCDQPATIIAQGCGDAQPVLMCTACLDRGIEVIGTYIHLWMRLNKRIPLCGACNRPIIRLDTHCDVRKLAR